MAQNNLYGDTKTGQRVQRINYSNIEKFIGMCYNETWFKYLKSFKNKLKYGESQIGGLLNA